MILYPDGKSAVIPKIRPDLTFVKLAVLKLVNSFTVVPYKFAPVKLQVLLNIVDDKLVPDKSKDVILIAEYDPP
jgi:hypothetical protein